MRLACRLERRVHRRGLGDIAGDRHNHPAGIAQLPGDGLRAFEIDIR